ncbi:MAG: alpha/beta hydrolase [Acidobacteria bacterium]|nr:alpha/beta hydrolase [Acidobacteriota bacterium]
MKAQEFIKKITVNAQQLSYIERGEGDPLVFVHGSLSDFRTWSSQIRSFSRLYRVIAYSQRYHYPNHSVGSAVDYSPLAHAEDLAELVKSLKLGPIHVVASSYGAYTALFLAIGHSELVRTLVLGEPPILPLLKSSPEGNALFTAFMTDAWGPSRRAFENGNLQQGVRLFIDAVMGVGSFDKLPPPVQSSMMDNVEAKRAEISTPESRCFPIPTCRDLNTVKAPTLLLSGKDSPRMFHVITETLRRCLPNMEWETISAASHTMHLANPQEYNKKVLSFIRRRA